jgi:hypothetical protein
MPENNSPRKQQRELLSLIILFGSLLAVFGLALAVIILDKSKTITIFNMVLPVVASWVGTILAFYFGRENFESANKQVRDIMQQSGTEKPKTVGITTIMKPFADMKSYRLSMGQTDDEVKIKELQKLLEGKVNRLPVVDMNNVVRYMIHEASLDKYIAKGGSDEDSLAAFLKKQKEQGVEFGLNQAFVVVAEKASILEANAKMEEYPFVRDVFVTRGGTPNEPYIGWASNVRLIKFMEV